MVQEDNTFIINGPQPLEPLTFLKLGTLVYDRLLSFSFDVKHAALKRIKLLEISVRDVLEHKIEQLFSNLTDPVSLIVSEIPMVDAVTGDSISYRELLGTSCLLAESLQKSGYGLATMISICSENNLQFFIPVIAALYNGSTIAPLNHNYTTEELQHTASITKPKVVFCSRQTSRKFIEMKSSTLKFIELIVVIDSEDTVPGAVTMNEFIRRTLGHFTFSYKVELANYDPDDQVAFVMCSSGTTGLPKGVMQTHTNIIVRYLHTLDPRYVTKSDRFLGILPFFHGYGLVTNFMALLQAQQIVVIKKFEEEVFLRTVQDYKISQLWIAPPLVLLLAKSPLVPKYDLTCVKEVTSGAAPLSKNTEEAVKKRLNIPYIRQGYGLTEATLATIMMEIGGYKPGSSGRVCTYMSCKIRDPETGRSLGPNQVGEICLKGPMVMKGYFGNEEATKESFTSDGWLRTGDLAYYDEDHYFFVVDRLKELIKYKGFQVAPAELEAILTSNPKIQDAGVIGVPREDVGEWPLAFVVKNDANLTEKEVEEFVAQKVSQHKHLRGGVIFVPAIPKNPSGKILRRELRKMLTTYKSKM